jgi:hypothetical protein
VINIFICILSAVVINVVLITMGITIIDWQYWAIFIPVWAIQMAS